MKPSELVSFLVQTFTARIPVLVQGAPGIGKTDLVTQAAALTGNDVVVSCPALADPTDSKGMPWIVDGCAIFTPFGETKQVLTCTKPTVWFWDELGQATPAVQTSYMPWLRAREVNGHRLPDHVTIIAATNRRTDKAGVSGLLEPIKSRFASIVELEPDLNEWCSWAMDHAVDPVLIAFLRFKSDLLCAFAASNDLTNSPVPRTWAHVDQLLKLDLTPSVRAAVIAGAVGEGAATEFLAFYRLYNELPNVDQILMGTDVPIPTAPATLYALTGALAHRTTEQNFGRVARFAERMVQDGRGEFGVLLVRDATKRCPKAIHTQAYVKLVVGDMGQLISGR